MEGCCTGAILPSPPFVSLVSELDLDMLDEWVDWVVLWGELETQGGRFLAERYALHTTVLSLDL